jgi:hypothetical protein
MDLMILKKKIDGYRAANGSIKNVAPELLLELRQAWENYTGGQDQFRSELAPNFLAIIQVDIRTKQFLKG